MRELLSNVGPISDVISQTIEEEWEGAGTGIRRLRDAGGRKEWRNTSRRSRSQGDVDKRAHGATSNRNGWHRKRSGKKVNFEKETEAWAYG